LHNVREGTGTGAPPFVRTEKWFDTKIMSVFICPFRAADKTFAESSVKRVHVKKYSDVIILGIYDSI